MGLWDTIKTGAKSIWEGAKDTGRNLWEGGKKLVKTSKDFLDNHGESIGKLLKVGEGLGLSKGFSNKVSGGLGKIRDVTKRAEEIQQQVDEAMGIGPELG